MYPPNKSELLRRDHSLLLRKGRAMDLTEQQVREIRKWAQRATPYVETVHLYGSRAKGRSAR
jgi:predicted nucleotidyltransferase